MSFLTSGTLLLLTGLTTLLPAASINYNPAATTDTGWSTCANLAGLHCRTTAYFDAMTLSDQNDTSLSALFQSAFTAWNATGGGQGWTLVTVQPSKRPHLIKSEESCIWAWLFETKPGKLNV